VAAGSLTAEASPFAYVANFSSRAVSVIDTASNDVVAHSAGGRVAPGGGHDVKNEPESREEGVPL